MKRVVLSGLGVLGVLAAIPGVSAETSTVTWSGQEASPFMRIYGPSQPPYGFVRFCEERPGACASQGRGEIRFHPSPERLSELDEVNRGVNRLIAPATDSEVYGISEYWTLPLNRGDCEDYALLKQKVLMAR